MKGSIFENYKTYYVYINNRPVWDYKIHNNELCLIAYDIENELEQVNCKELLDFLNQEEILPSEIEVVDEESRKSKLMFIVENNKVLIYTVED